MKARNALGLQMLFPDKGIFYAVEVSLVPVHRLGRVKKEFTKHWQIWNFDYLFVRHCGEIEKLEKIYNSSGNELRKAKQLHGFI